MASLAQERDDHLELLFVSTSTVKTHMRHVYEKLGVHRRSDAVIGRVSSGCSLWERGGAGRTLQRAADDPFD